MRAQREGDYIACPSCGFTLAAVIVGPAPTDPHRFAATQVPTERLVWKQGWREADGRLTFGRHRHGRRVDVIDGRRVREPQAQGFLDATEATCPRCYEVVDIRVV